MPQAQQLGRYQLLDRIAYGGMAEIYRAKTFDGEGRARLVAVKRVLQHLTTDEDFIRMLVDEAKITATLDHPSVARVYEFSQAGEEYFIAMEYVDGKDVRALLEKHRQQQIPIPPEHAAWIVAAIAEGLQAAHTQADADGRSLAIVHRDVSPSNCLCSYTGEVKLCDFGIAKATLTRVQTRTGVIKGKVKYMSPEQAMGRKLDARSDLFSLGTVLYEMLTLEAPFTAATEVELIFTVRDARRRDARELVPSIPEPLNIILNRMMERQRTDRYQSGRELARDLRACLEKMSPGYRRGTFSRYMRASFQDEIEKELRQLEGWVIEGGDASNIGVNLIADALPADAPFRGFSPASSISIAGVVLDSGKTDLPSQATSIFQRAAAGLHEQPTQIIDRRAIAGDPKAGLHHQSTMMLEGRDAAELRAKVSVHDRRTQLFSEPSALERPASASGSVHSREPTPNPPNVSDPALVETNLLAQVTRIQRDGEGVPGAPPPPLRSSPPPLPRPTPPPPPRPRARHDTAPDPPKLFDRELDATEDPTVLKPPPPEKVYADFSGDEDTGTTNPRGETDLDD